MSYFNKFSHIKYDFTTKTDLVDQIDIVQDLMTRSTLYVESTDSNLFFQPYLVQEGEKPEVIAYNMYGDPQLHWTVMFVNQVFDIYSDWPLDSASLSQYCIDKYGADKINLIHHWEILPDQMEIGRVVYDTTIEGSTTTYTLRTDLSGLIFANGKVRYESAVVEGALYDEYEYATYTNFEHEVRLNELKRRIKIIRPQFIGKFVSMFNDSLING